GYIIPKYYVGGAANSVESILGGEADAKTAFQRLLQSATHRRHLLGEGETYAAQNRFGIAYLGEPKSRYAHYWVIIIAENRREDRPMICSPSPPICIVGPRRSDEPREDAAAQ